MAAKAETHNRELISQILAVLKETADLGEAGEAFVETLFARGIPEDLAQYRAGDLARIAFDAWSRFQTHRTGTHQIHISNPDMEIRSEYYCTPT